MNRRFRKPTRMMKESYSDINYSNVWDAYEIALEYLGAKELCESLAKAMGTDELEFLLKHIFKDWEIPFGDDEDEDFDESCGMYTRNESLRRSRHMRRNRR